MCWEKDAKRLLASERICFRLLPSSSSTFLRLVRGKGIKFRHFFALPIENLKVYRSEGRTLFIVYVYPSKNKLYHLRNKKYLFIFTCHFSPNPALQWANYLFWFQKHKSALPYSILRTLENLSFIIKMARKEKCWKDL